MGGSELTLAALPAGLMVRDVLPLFERFKNGSVDQLQEEAPLIAAAIAESLNRGGNADAVTAQDVLDNCDFAQLMDLFLEVVKTNGMGNRGAQGEAPAPIQSAGAEPSPM